MKPLNIDFSAPQVMAILNVTPDSFYAGSRMPDAGTVALGWECLRQGAKILRVHDVREAADTVRLFNMFRR